MDIPERVPLVEFKVQIVDRSPSATFVNGIDLTGGGVSGGKLWTG